MNDPIQVRRKLRMVLSALPMQRKWAREEFLLSELNDRRLLAEKATVDELKVAIEWNQARGFIDFRYDRDDEKYEWFLTESGRHKEGLA